MGMRGAPDGIAPPAEPLELGDPFAIADAADAGAPIVTRFDRPAPSITAAPSATAGAPGRAVLQDHEMQDVARRAAGIAAGIGTVILGKEEVIRACVVALLAGGPVIVEDFTGVGQTLLECMEERQATIDNVTYPIEPPFMVIATQNPIEYEGTYPLPEAQLDRFMMRLSLGYPAPEAEDAIIQEPTSRDPLADLKPVLTGPEV